MQPHTCLAVSATEATDSSRALSPCSHCTSAGTMARLAVALACARRQGCGRGDEGVCRRSYFKACNVILPGVRHNATPRSQWHKTSVPAYFHGEPLGARRRHFCCGAAARTRVRPRAVGSTALWQGILATEDFSCKPLALDQRLWPAGGVRPALGALRRRTCQGHLPAVAAGERAWQVALGRAKAAQ